MHEAHDSLICIKNKTYINEKNRIRFSDQHYLKNDIEMSELFADLPVALENNYNFVYRCNFRPLLSKPILPNISSAKDGDADETLRKDTYLGLKNKFNNIFNIKDENFSYNKKYIEYKDRYSLSLLILSKQSRSGKLRPKYLEISRYKYLKL